VIYNLCWADARDRENELHMLILDYSYLQTLLTDYVYKRAELGQRYHISKSKVIYNLCWADARDRENELHLLRLDYSYLQTLLTI
jgi:dTDP-D-glucose 4,6-dehydratase